MANNGQRDSLLTVRVLTENCKRPLKDGWLNQGDKSMKGCLTCLHECMLTINVNMSGAKGMSPLDRLPCFSGGSEEERVSKEAGVLSFPLQLFPSLPTWCSGEELDDSSFHPSFQFFTVYAPWLLSSSLAHWAIKLVQ